MSVVRVDPAYTSLTCSRCGVAQFDASAQERNRIRFRCPDCGNDLNRSVNAAKNIYWREDWHSRLSLRKNQSSQGGPVWENQRRRYLPSVRKTALVRSIAPQGASCISADGS